MKIEDCKRYFEDTLIELEKDSSINQKDLNNIFKNINEIHKFENDYIYVVVPDALTKFKIERFYSDKMNSILEELAPTKCHYKFITQDEAVKEKESEINKITAPEQVNINKSRRRLRAEFTFDNFVIGESNRFAFLSAMKVAESPHSILNPLYIFGDVGLGKTHLMMAIGHYVLDNNINANVVYTSAQQFVEDYFLSTSTKKGRENIEEFYNHYRSADLLLVDDIQFLEGKTSTQAEFFKVFDYLHENNKQIVITSDRVANDLKLMARLKSRFNWGMIADIKAPDKELRVNILKRKLAFLLNNPKDIPIEVLDRIASLFETNIRDLEGALRRYVTYCVSLDLPFTVENVEVALGSIIPKTTEEGERITSINNIKNVVASYFQLPIDILSSRSRKTQIVYARNIAIYIIRDKLKTPLKKIGEAFGNRDHATIAHGYEKIQNLLKTDQHVKSDVEYLLKKLDLE
ncbi:MAG TPA: chromosomal replication initiator protein DnaA [Acholeplasmataceae bacterium]|jgi:chromosomal replication initiator protein|nr:chromosomal replication initiator protein DnaA [Acholeplasmataceae bacterium]